MIKKCSLACNSCLGDYNEQNTNCIDCAIGYYKTEDSDTNCMIKELIPQNFYLNPTDNIYYRCHQNCKSCEGPYIPDSESMICINCIDNILFLMKKIVIMILCYKLQLQKIQFFIDVIILVLNV